MGSVNQKTIVKRVKNALKFFFLGYGWKAFLLRLCIVVISFILNPFDFAVDQSATAPMKLFLFTCAFLAYAILMLVLDYTERGKEFEAKRREAEKANEKINGV